LRPEKDLLPARRFFGGGEIPYSINHPPRTGLYTAYEYPEFMPTVTIRWEELDGIGV